MADRLPGNYVRFGPFELSKTERVLRREGAVVAIPPKALLILQVLLEAGGQVVAKERIIEVAWPDSFVEDASLAQTISVLRKQLADDYPDESPIANIPRVGYFFRGALQEYDSREDNAIPSLPSEAAADETTSTALHEIPEAEPPGIPTVLEPPVSAPRTRQGWMWGLLAAAVPLLFAVWFFHMRSAVALPHPLTLEPFTHNESENPVRAAAISPDGTLLVYADSDGVILRVIASGVIHSLKSPAAGEISQLAWYPDGLHLLASLSTPKTGEQQIWRLSVTGDEPVLLRENARQGTPAPDGTRIAFASSQDAELWVAGSSGESPHRLLQAGPGESFPVLLWSDDSRHLLFQKLTFRDAESAKPSKTPQGQLEMRADYVAIDVASGAVTAQREETRFNTACLLAPDKLLLSRLSQDTDAGASTLWTAGLDTATGALISEPLETQTPKTGRLYDLTCSRMGGNVSAVVRGGSPDVYVGDLVSPEWKLQNVRRLTNDAQTDFQHGWTRDSSTVFFESDRGGLFQIYRQALDRRDPEIVAPTNTSQVFPQLSPDGAWVLYESNTQPAPRPPYKLFRVPIGGGAPTQVSDETIGEYRCPNSGTLCVTRERAGASMIFYALDPMKGKGARIAGMPWIPGTWGAWDISPDGSTLAVPSQSPVKPEITLLDTHAGDKPPQVIALAGEGPISAIHWAADGDGWFVVIRKTVGEKLFHVDRKGTAIFLRDTSGPTWANPSPDGKKLAFVDQTVDSNVWLSDGTVPRL